MFQLSTNEKKNNDPPAIVTSGGATGKGAWGMRAFAQIPKHNFLPPTPPPKKKKKYVEIRPKLTISAYKIRAFFAGPAGFKNLSS